MKKLLWVLLLGVSSASAQALTQAERDRAVAQLQASRKAFLEATKDLTPAQWSFKPAPDRWSIAECAEHIAVSEDFIMHIVTDQIMKTPAAPERKEEVAGKDDFILKAAADRSQKFKAPEPLVPTGRWAGPEETVKHFLESRDSTIRYVTTTQDELRSHFSDHPALKTLDGYQWILLVSAHSGRHTAQIEEVKADANFPKK